MQPKQLRLLVIPIALAAVLILLLLTTVSRWTRSAYAAALSSNPAAQLELMSSLGGSITSIAVSGTIAYVGQGGTFATFDISNPTQISRLAYILLPSPSFAAKIQVVGSLAYIAYGSNSDSNTIIGGLQIVDVSNPVSLQSLGSYSVGNPAGDLEVQGNFVYLTFSSPVTASLQILDVTDPALPVYQGGYSGEGYNGIDVVDGLAYLAGSLGLKIIDVQDPSNPVLRGSYRNRIFNGDAQDVQVEGNLAVLVTSGGVMNGQLQVINVSNPMTPTLLGSYIAYESYDVVSVSGDFAYVGGIYDGLDIIDLTTPTTPTLSSHYPFGTLDLQIVNSRAYLAGSRNGMHIVDINSPSNPIHLGDYELFGFLADVQAQPPYIYVTDEIREIAILDGTDPSSPLLLTSLITPGYGRDLKVIGDVAYLNRYNYGFDIFDVTDPTSPALLSHYNPSHGSYTAMTTDGNHAYIGELGNGMNVLDVSDPSNPQYLGNTGYISGSGPQTIKAVGNLVYIAAGNGGLVMVDASNPISPSIISITTRLSRTTRLHVNLRCFA